MRNRSLLAELEAELRDDNSGTTGVRTALAELVGELLDAAAEDQPPSKQAVDNAMPFIITGDRNIVTVVGSQTTTNGNSTITVTDRSDQPTANTETCKRGLLIGPATVVAAVAAVLQLYGWVPWKSWPAHGLDQETRA